MTDAERKKKQTEYLKKYFSNPVNKERHKTRCRQWKKRNKEMRLANPEAMREWREDRAKYYRQYRKENREEYNAWQAKYQRERRERLKRENVINTNT